MAETTVTQPRRPRMMALHLVRVLLFAAIISLIHWQHLRITAEQSAKPLPPIPVDSVRRFFPDAASVATEASPSAGRAVQSADGASLGYVLQTSPDSDHVIGFSGPTNVLIAFSDDDTIAGIDVLSSGDTRDHVEEVLRDEHFLKSFNGKTWKEASAAIQVDAVSGATLTSLAIQEAIIFRLSGGQPSLRFPDPITLEQAQALFETAASLAPDTSTQLLWRVFDTDGAEIGSLLRTSPFADNIVGFQGPTETLIGFDVGGQVVGISLGKSYDNEEYVTYVREDEYFLSLFNELQLQELAVLNLEEAQVEGVSGATMSSMAVAEGVLLAAQQHHEAIQTPPPETERPWFTWTLRDLGTGVVILAGLIIAFTSLRGNTYVRVGFQILLIGYLGLINGDMVSQAMIVGWAKSGVPWSSAGGLVLLTCAAFLAPITTKRNVYCTHLCPHGAVQHLLKDRLRWRLRLPRWGQTTLKLIPVALLLWCLIVPMAALPFSLVDIEPFDAWVFRIAGWATITIAVVGLIASLFIPMAYCRYGCPTGTLLGYLRFNAKSDQWSRQDSFAAAMVAVACGMMLL